MTNQEAALRVIEALESLSVPYMLVGSLSSNAFGIPRSTQDADLVVELGAVSIRQIAERLGKEFELDSQMSFETIGGSHRYLFNLPHSGFTIEVFLVSDDPYDRERFSRRKQAPTLGRMIWLPMPEDVIVMKMRWSKQGRRTKDVDDVKNVIAVQGDRLDWPYIHRWCDAHGTRELLDSIRRSIPAI